LPSSAASAPTRSTASSTANAARNCSRSCCQGRSSAYLPCQAAGRPRLPHGRRGKSGLHGTTVPGNARRIFSGRFRESATENIPPVFGLVRSKRCGKSAPRLRQRGRHGKPHRVQDRIGVAHEPVPARHPGWSLERRSNPSPRGMVAQVPQGAGQNPAYRPPGVLVLCSSSQQKHKTGGADAHPLSWTKHGQGNAIR
jgi:hypothetical protein